MRTDFTKGWLPVDIQFDSDPALITDARVVWLEVGSQPLDDPFFGQTVQKLRDAVRAQRGKTDTLATVQKAAAQLEQAAEEAGPKAPAKSNVQRVVIEKPRFDIREHLWNGTLGLLLQPALAPTVPV